MLWYSKLNSCLISNESYKHSDSTCFNSAKAFRRARSNALQRNQTISLERALAITGFEIFDEHLKRPGNKGGGSFLDMS